MTMLPDPAAAVPLPDDVAALVDGWDTARQAAGYTEPAACILAAAVLTDMLPGRVTTYACSVMFANRLAQGHLGQLRGRRMADVDPAAYTVGVLTDAAGNRQSGRYQGHVVVVVDGQWLVDVTAPHYDRPQRGLRIRQPVVLDLVHTGTPSALWGGIGRQWDLADLGIGRGWCHYTLLPEVTDWQGAADWRFPNRRQPVIQALRQQQHLDGDGGGS